jgi:hypothetical protein
MTVVSEVELLIVTTSGGAEDPDPKPKAQLCQTEARYHIRILDKDGKPLAVLEPRATPEAAVEDARTLRVIMRNVPFRSLLRPETAEPIPFDRAKRRDPSVPEPA